MNTLRLRPFMYFAMGIAVTAVAAWSLSAWRASAAVSPDESTFVAVSPTRILDTREELGLAGPFVSPVAQDLRVTGTILTKSGTIVVVPDGATGVVLNVTVVGPTAAGFVSIRPADAPGVPTTSSLNFNAGDVIPNAVTVQMPTSGGDAGRIEIMYDAFGNAGPTTEMLIDVVGYTKNAGLASLQAEVDQLEAIVNAATAPNAVTQDQIASGAVGSSEIAPSVINNTHIVSNSLTVDNLGPNSVGASELINGTVGMQEMNATVRNDVSVTAPAAPDVVSGQCTPDIPIAVDGAPAGTEALVLGSRQATGLINNGWSALGGDATLATAGFVRIRICNETGVAAQPPSLLVSFIALGP